MPIQVLPAPQRNPSFLESLGAGLGQSIPEAVQGYFDKKQQAQKMLAENEQLKKMGIDLSGIQDPKMRQAAFAEAIKGQEKRKTKKSEFEEIQNFIKSRESAGQKLRGEQPQAEIQEDQGYNASEIPDEIITYVTATSPAVGKDLRHAKDVALREASEKENRQQKENIERRKETLPLRKEYADKAKYARQGIENKKSQVALIKSGKINDPVTIALAKYLPGAVGNKLLSAETQVYQSGLFEEFGVLKNMFPGQVRVKEIELLEDKLATLEKSDEAKEEILETGILKSEKDIIMAKHAREFEKENPNATYLELEEEVAKRAQPDLDKLYNKLIDRYENIYLRHAPAKSSWTDQHGKVYRNVPKERLKEFMDEAKKNGLEIRVKK